MLLAVTTVACTPPPECEVSGDCASGEACISGTCKPFTGSGERVRPGEDRDAAAGFFDNLPMLEAIVVRCLHFEESSELVQLTRAFASVAVGLSTPLFGFVSDAVFHPSGR